MQGIIINAADKIAPVTNEDKDWIGIHATRSNAQFIRTIFKDIADPTVIDIRHRLVKLKYPVTVGSGWRPGWSTDYVAITTAYDLGIPEVIIAGKPDFVYDKDPHEYKDANNFSYLNWGEYRDIIDDKWVPGLSMPVDPVAARFAEENNIKAIVINGKDLKNLEDLLKGYDFRGTLLK